MELQGTRRLGSGRAVRVGRGLGVVVAAVAGLAGRAGATTPADWLVAGDGAWTDGTRWSTTPDAPNNGAPAGAAYDVRIGATGQAYTVWLYSAVRVDSVTVDSPDATLRVVGPGATLETPVLRVDRGRVLFDGGVAADGRVPEGASLVRELTDS